MGYSDPLQRFLEQFFSSHILILHVLGECLPLVKTYEEAVNPVDKNCGVKPNKDLEKYIFCEEVCAKPQYTCQLKTDFQNGWMVEYCQKDGVYIFIFKYNNYNISGQGHQPSGYNQINFLDKNYQKMVII